MLLPRHVGVCAARYISTTRPAAGNQLSLESVNAIHSKNLSPTLVPYYKKPLLIEKGYMQHLWDNQGKQYLDLFGGIVTVSVGHCHPRLVEVATAQMKKLWHTTQIYLTGPIHEYAQKLTSKLPPNLSVCYFVNSGSEANDMALTLARLYTGNLDIVSLRNGYHGTSNLVSGVTSLGNWRNKLTVSNIHATANPDVYRGPWGGSNCRDSPCQTDRACDCERGECQASDRYFEQLEDVFNHSIPKDGAAGFIAEAIQGVGGSVHPPKKYLSRAAKLVRDNGGVVIADEVQTGFGRLGSHFWGFQSHGITPDIVTMAKGMGNGFPMGAVVTSPEIANSLNKALYFNTFGGNPVASTVGSTVLDIIEEEGLQENSARVGTYFLERLSELKEGSDVIGDVRGKGLMIGLELVENKETRKPLSVERTTDLFEATKEGGILMGRGGLYKNVLRIKPPMCISTSDVDEAMTVLTKVFSRK